jgi:hypothetical protein
VSAPHEDDRALPPGGNGAGSGAGSGAGMDVEALGAVLRRHMEQAVAGLEPRPGTLDMLRRAVPARRRRRQAALATTAVTVFAVGAGATLAVRGALDSGEPRRAGSTDVGNLLSTGGTGVPGGGSGHGPGPVGGQQMSSASSAFTTAVTSATSLSQTSKAPPPSSSAPNTGATTTPPGLPPCQSSSVAAVVGVQNPPIGGVTYETVIGTVKTACILTGTPTLAVSAVAGVGGGVGGGVSQVKPDPAIAPLLAGVPAGRTLMLQAGDRFEFQYAWVPAACSSQPPATSAATSSAATSSPTNPTELPTTPTTIATSAPATSGTPAPTPTRPPTPASSSSSSVRTTSSYSVSFALSGTQPQQTATFAAACGATLYVTDFFPPEGQGIRHGGDAPTATVSPTR